MGGRRTGDEVAIHWNNDVVVAMPPGGVVLARTPGGEVQVARFGDRARGASSRTPRSTPTSSPAGRPRTATTSSRSASTRHVVLAEIKDAEPALEAHWRPLLARFAAIAGEER